MGGRFFRVSYNSYADFNNTKIKKSKDEYADYMMYFGKNKIFIVYNLHKKQSLPYSFNHHLHFFCFQFFKKEND